MKDKLYKVTYKVTYKDGRQEEIKTDYKSSHFIDVEAILPHKRYAITLLKVDYNDYIEIKKVNYF